MVYKELWLGVLAGLPFLFSKDLYLDIAEIYQQMCHDCYLSCITYFTIITTMNYLLKLLLKTYPTYPYLEVIL